MGKKIIIAHVSKQHSFHTATVLKRENVLYKYITTVYDKPNSLTSKSKFFLKGNIKKKASSRRCEELDDQEVLQFYEILGLLRIYLSRFKLYKNLNLDVFVMKLFYRRVVNYVIKKNVDTLIIYDSIADCSLDRLKKRAPHIKIIMDVSISSRPFMKDVFSKDMKAHDHEYFYGEEKLLFTEKLKHVYKNFKNTDYFLVPSKVVYKSLLFCDVDKDKLKLLPYGVSINQFQFNKKEIKEGPVKLLFVGAVSYRKGVHHLLNVISKYSKRDLVLSLAGGYDIDGDLYKKYSGLENVNFMGFVTRDIIAKVFQESDFFILPSLGEGLALVILEALATGTPVICTEMSGGNDAIIDYENGIVTEAGNVTSLKNGIDWIIENKKSIPNMSLSARETAMKYTWDNYYANFKDILKSILDE